MEVECIRLTRLRILYLYGTVYFMLDDVVACWETVFTRLSGPRHMYLFPSNSCSRINTSESSYLFPIGNNNKNMSFIVVIKKCSLISKEIVDDYAGNLATKDNNIKII